MDEVRLKRELSDICHKAGVLDWKPLVKAIFDWIEAAREPERVRRLEAVKTLCFEVKVLVRILQPRKARSELEDNREKIHKLLKEFVEKLSRP